VEEAGGKVTDLTGGMAIPALGVMATNGLLHAEVLMRLATS
jgi:fructose-1,6-bisphosphatase/inositol monophosphatase family enzyme